MKTMKNKQKIYLIFVYNQNIDNIHNKNKYFFSNPTFI